MGTFITMGAAGEPPPEEPPEDDWPQPRQARTAIASKDRMRRAMKPPPRRSEEKEPILPPETRQGGPRCFLQPDKARIQVDALLHRAPPRGCDFRLRRRERRLPRHRRLRGLRPAALVGQGNPDVGRPHAGG